MFIGFMAFVVLGLDSKNMFRQALIIIKNWRWFIPTNFTSI